MGNMSNLEKAKSRLVVDHPFFATLLLKRPLIEATWLPYKTMAVDEAGNIYYDPDFVASRTVDELVFGLAHECMHLMLAHPTRRGGRDRKKWNYAGDAVINDTLKAEGVGQFIRGGVDWPGGKDDTTESIYRQLPEDEEPDQDGSQGGGDGQDDDQDDGQGGPGGMGDDIIPGDASQAQGADEARTMDESERAEAEAQVQTDVAQAAQSARMQGKLGGALAQLVDEILTVSTPWYDILERFMVDRAQHDYSWRRPNRRFVGRGTYLPSLDDEGALGEVVLAVDTSASVSDEELAYFAGHLNAIMEQAKPTQVHVVYCDTRVAHVDEYTASDLPLKLTRHGGGGTLFAPVFEWVEAQDIEPSCLVYFTDGGGDQNHLGDPGYPVLWLTTFYEYGFQFGEVVKYDGEG